MDASWQHTVLQNIGTFAGYVFVGVAAVASTRAKEWVEKRRGRKAAGRAVAANVLINNFLAECRLTVDADRIMVLQFHNGEHFASGSSVQKISLTHHVLRAGVAFPVSPDGASFFFGVPASFMTETLQASFANGGVMAQDGECQDIWVQREQALNGVKTTIVCLIPGSKPGEAFGLLSFAWNHPMHDASAIDKCMVFAKRVSLFL